MPRPFNRRQARENAAFLRVLTETGNVELAARECGLRKGTLYSRRKVNAGFAAEWDAALTAAQAAMRADPKRAARAGKGRWPDSPNAAPRFATAPSGAGRFKVGDYKTGGGEPTIVRLKDGRLQLRRARRGGIGFRTEQVFLRALATCGNISMAARAVGVAPTNIDAKRRRCPVFRAEMEAAIAMASDRLEAALLERADAALAGEGADSIWAEEGPGPISDMSADQAMMLLNLHRRRMALGDYWGRLATRKRRGPMSSEEWRIERDIWWGIEKRKHEAAERRRARGVARARHYEETGNWFLPGEEVPDALRADAGRSKRRPK